MRGQVRVAQNLYYVYFNGKKYSGETKSILMKNVKEELGFRTYHTRKNSVVLVGLN